VGRLRLGQLARPDVPRGRQGRRAARGQADGPQWVRPRDLRSSFATLLIYEGQPPQYVAEQLGDSAATLLRDYARVWEDFDPSQRVSAEEQIERVRRRLRRGGTAQVAEREAGDAPD
jgi:integrase